ncbi:unnamed protein product [Owenia fusiformis]|uniref:Transmembrane protein 14C n=1 Tax=Owenia fusiformis TaxID=6347 RepID=A0A8S4N2C0_OWEFU|nr:unnamed protein product [Owenia fusiformis]
MADVLGYLYAATVAGGGVVGYVKAGSSISLGMGLLFGSILGFGAHLTSQDPKNVWVTLVAGGMLAGVMGSRFYNSGKFMPAGMVMTISLLMVGRNIYRLTQP